MENLMTASIATDNRHSDMIEQIAELARRGDTARAAQVAGFLATAMDDYRHAVSLEQALIKLNRSKATRTGTRAAFAQYTNAMANLKNAVCN